jgi:hypothetical protein
MLREAVRALEPEGVRVVRHSCLYHTAPAYVTDQPRFLNAAVLAHTRLPPASLLDSLKRIEQQLGRDLAGPVSTNPERAQAEPTAARQLARTTQTNGSSVGNTPYSLAH